MKKRFGIRFTEQNETITGICHTCDNKWKKPFGWNKGEIIAWIPLPESCKEVMKEVE